MGGRNPKYVSVPSSKHIARISANDMIIYFRRKKGHITRCVLWGLVRKISKGNEFDILYVLGGGLNLLTVVVKKEPARKQIATCKVNQWCNIIADSLAWFEDGKSKAILYAVAIQGWYVPKVMDIQQVPDEELGEPMDDKEYAEGQDFLSQYENN